MAKVKEAQKILASMGLPKAQQGEVAAYTLLALADLGKTTAWNQAKRRSLKIHDMLIFIKEKHGKIYAENSRETVRRQVLHQLEQARIVDRNPDEPGLATNSPRTHYALAKNALRAIKTFNTPSFDAAARRFTKRHGALLEVYQAARKWRLIPVRLSSGEELTLSPGAHNALQAAIVKGFAPRFARGARLLYLGDTAKKHLHVKEAELKRLRVPVTKHDKLPDIVLYSPRKNWLFLVEAVASHGPVSPKRKRELETVLEHCPAQRIYVSAFPDAKEFKRHAENIAWETEVWIAEMPDHLIHFNGDKFLGPAIRASV